MTTDELVKDFIKALRELENDEVMRAFEKYAPKKVIDDFDREVWSIALNYDTRDVRYIECDLAFGTVEEVRAVIKHEVYTQYLR